MRRIRTSTWVLLAIFLGTLVLYLWVKPPTHSATTGDSPAGAQQSSSPASSHTQKPAPRRTAHRSPAPSATPSPHRTATPRQTVTPHPTIAPTTAPPSSPAPSPSSSATVPGTP